MKNNDKLGDLHDRVWISPGKLPSPPKHIHNSHNGKLKRKHLFISPLELKATLLILLVSVIVGLLIAFISEQITQKSKQQLSAPETAEEVPEAYKEQVKQLMENYKNLEGGKTK